jgi:hypothetical protein
MRRFTKDVGQVMDWTHSAVREVSSDMVTVRSQFGWVLS